MPRALGDSHNFGRRVALRGKRIAKPRTVVWEWLLLSAKSPLRRLLDAIDASAFGFLPDLAFSFDRDGHGGTVERVALAPLGKVSIAERRELARTVGRATALFAWLGIADLHWENLALGRGKRGRIVFTPLDVEMILDDLALPTQTKLLPDADPEYADVCRHACGVRRVLPWLGKPIAPDDLVAMAAAYVEVLTLLERHAAAIGAAIAVVPDLAGAPIRVCLRGTGDYVRARSEPVWPPLLDAEAEQLARGDIPYFFRLYGRTGIHYYANASLTKAAKLPSVGDVPKLEPLLRLSRGLRSPLRKKLREEGLFTVLGAFDHPSYRGRFTSDGLAVTFGARSLVVELPTGEELQSKRNLRAFVGSVYLDCCCGEVRSTLVPHVTVCSTLSGS